jgi:hypothetical protein
MLWGVPPGHDECRKNQVLLVHLEDESTLGFQTGLGPELPILVHGKVVSEYVEPTNGIPMVAVDLGGESYAKHVKASICRFRIELTPNTPWSCLPGTSRDAVRLRSTPRSQGVSLTMLKRTPRAQ